MKNVPNIITTIRLVLIPFIFFFFLADTATGGFIPYGQPIATGIFIIAAITDFLDGYLARKYKVVSDLGKILDPMADKLLTLSGLVLIGIAATATATLPAWAVAVVLFAYLGRDFSIDTLRGLAMMKGKVISANWSGKIRTIIGMPSIAYMLLMCYNNALASPFITGTPKTVFDIIGFVLIGLTVLLNLYSWFFYFYDNREVFITKKPKQDKEQKQLANETKLLESAKTKNKGSKK